MRVHTHSETEREGVRERMGEEGVRERRGGRENGRGGCKGYSLSKFL